jgi:hypothetical protein
MLRKQRLVRSSTHTEPYAPICQLIAGGRALHGSRGIAGVPDPYNTLTGTFTIRR